MDDDIRVEAAILVLGLWVIKYVHHESEVIRPNRAHTTTPVWLGSKVIKLRP